MHGKPTRERYENPEEPKPHEANWLPWLGKQLKARGIEVSIPALPLPYFPVYEDWKSTALRGVAVGPDTSFIAHSASADFVLRLFSEDKEAVAEQLVLVAPYHDYAGKYGEFSKYTLDSEILKRVERMTILNSLDDDEPIQTRAHELATIFPEATLLELDGYGHFRIGHNMRGEELPILLDVLGI